jgi:hypothetical protein
MTQKMKLLDLHKIASGLNIEGYRPTLSLPKACKWYNIIQVIDEPLKGINFDDIMKIVNDNKYQYIEQAINIDIDNFINTLTNLINEIKSEHKNLLVHVHQYTKTTILDKTLEKKTGVKTILDTTNFFETPIDYKQEYPDIDGLLSISQCAGFGLEAGTWIIPSGFMNFDVKNNVINTDVIFAENHIEKYVKFDANIVKGNILVVNDLWNPNLNVQDHVLIYSDSDKH